MTTDSRADERAIPAVPVPSPDMVKWKEKGAQLIKIAALTAEISALGNHEDNEGERPETRRANDRADRALADAVEHLSAVPVLPVQPNTDTSDHRAVNRNEAPCGDTFRGASRDAGVPLLDPGYTSDDLLKALAECRDAFPAPEHGAPAEHEWMQAIADPLHVPVYVKAMAAGKPQAPCSDDALALLRQARDVLNETVPDWRSPIEKQRRLSEVLAKINAHLAAQGAQP